jgi:hypothetical protein
MISDIMDFVEVSTSATRRIQSLDANSGKGIRRSRTVLRETSTPVTTVSTGEFPYPPIGPAVSGGTLRTVVSRTRDVWFKGSFTYYLPQLDGSISSFYRRYQFYAHKLFGLQLDADLLWKLTPWSWASDWLLNTGSVVRNLSAFTGQGLVMNYGYLMETKTELTTWTLEGVTTHSVPLPKLTSGLLKVTKSRTHATPYGFGLNPASFTPFQTSIVTALGINRWSGWR